MEEKYLFDDEEEEIIIPSKELIKRLIAEYGINRSDITSFLYDVSKGQVDGFCHGSRFRISSDYEYLKRHDVLSHLYIDRDDIGHYIYTEKFYDDVKNIIHSLFREAELQFISNN